MMMRCGKSLYNKGEKNLHLAMMGGELWLFYDSTQAGVSSIIHGVYLKFTLVMT